MDADEVRVEAERHDLRRRLVAGEVQATALEPDHESGARDHHRRDRELVESGPDQQVGVGLEAADELQLRGVGLFGVAGQRRWNEQVGVQAGAETELADLDPARVTELEPTIEERIAGLDGSHDEAQQVDSGQPEHQLAVEGDRGVEAERRLAVEGIEADDLDPIEDLVAEPEELGGGRGALDPADDVAQRAERREGHSGLSSGRISQSVPPTLCQMSLSVTAVGAFGVFSLSE